MQLHVNDKQVFVAQVFRYLYQSGFEYEHPGAATIVLFYQCVYYLVIVTAAAPLRSYLIAQRRKNLIASHARESESPRAEPPSLASAEASSAMTSLTASRSSREGQHHHSTYLSYTWWTAMCASKDLVYFYLCQIPSSPCCFVICAVINRALI